MQFWISVVDYCYHDALHRTGKGSFGVVSWTWDRAAHGELCRASFFFLKLSLLGFYSVCDLFTGLLWDMSTVHRLFHGHTDRDSESAVDYFL